MREGDLRSPLTHPCFVWNLIPQIPHQPPLGGGVVRDLRDSPPPWAPRGCPSDWTVPPTNASGRRFALSRLISARGADEKGTDNVGTPHTHRVRIKCAPPHTHQVCTVGIFYPIAPAQLQRDYKKCARISGPAMSCARGLADEVSGAATLARSANAQQNARKAHCRTRLTPAHASRGMAGEGAGVLLSNFQHSGACACGTLPM